MNHSYLIGVDGGGSGTRVVVADATGRELARAAGAPSALSLGVGAAWRAIEATIEAAFRCAGVGTWAYGDCLAGLGVAGVHNAQWAESFRAAAPGFAHMRVATDGYATVLAAHGGQPGAIIAIGTGLVGEAWLGGDEVRTVSAWGFPSGDEGSGAWIGLRAAQLAEKALDGRASVGPLAQSVITHLGGNQHAALAWLGRATPGAYARLAPIVLAHGAHDAAAAGILREAGAEIAAVAQALDPTARLHLALCGGLADPLRPWLPDTLLQRCRPPLGDALSGALQLAASTLHGPG